ncbi:ABC transporter ATP-binding protein [Heyndrickxia ginsengihumi]|uniref:ABC transporter ATP-binding protein n=2 Tax=Heyndrickxia ginsengihumi TaxID=363870 RepID=A0A0A6V991_9BACI|nr:ABC transporter ATP-binding protein [Heyndrickxia ginsengihumi]KHD84675.1 aliphatic sulfonates transport ATP-binding subunit [Heyndrickxia ginsengihumi]MBE6183097.1 ABC transporter ATP-binding protein [Bacillus sp. (in: firmicutes)]MCM3023872.1 ABC transporter ATP-binding protein [Heyndrickxia ginsengihumi]NEY20557.1 ABC transporter ATP-binding protein [Heyndrickxia ginsengihumi]
MVQNKQIQIKHVTKSYGKLDVLKGINLSIEKGEFIAIVGKSGCGKSTLLRTIAGLEKIDSGTITIDGEELKGVNHHARMMFQDGRLLPWKRILPNVGIGLKGLWKEKAYKALKLVGLEDRAFQFPSVLSGGQKQRVALARALVHEPKLLLLDEPLGALDALTRLEMQNLVEDIWRDNKMTALLVTHDVEEAVRLADRIVLLEEGKIVLDQSISLSRPRKRSNPLFTRHVEEILKHIVHPQEQDKKHSFA